MKGWVAFSVCPLTCHIKAKILADQDAQTPSTSHLSWPLNRQADFLPGGLHEIILGSIKFLTFKSRICEDS